MFSSVPGGAVASFTASGGKIYAFNAITTAATVVAAVNPQRRRIVFHNPGDQDIFIAPSVVINSSGAQVPLNPSNLALGGCWRVYANGGSLEITGECQGSWQAFAVSGDTNPLTVMDSNV